LRTSSEVLKLASGGLVLAEKKRKVVVAGTTASVSVIASLEGPETRNLESNLE